MAAFVAQRLPDILAGIVENGSRYKFGITSICCFGYQLCHFSEGPLFIAGRS